MSRTAVLTGGSRGLGAVIVRQLEANGWKVAYCSRSLDLSAPQVNGNTIYAEAGDVGDQGFVNSFLRNVVDFMGAPRLLVNNAAIFGQIGSVLDFTGPQIMDVMRTNLIGVQNMCRSFLEVSDRLSHRAIVNIGGAGIGGRTPEKNAFPYLISKSALYWFTELLAEEVLHDGVSVNLLAPGAMPTTFMADTEIAAIEMGAQDLLNELEKRKNLEADKMYERIHDWIEFFASPASKHLTGRFLSAQWDDPVIAMSALDSEDSFRLRRIDNTMFGEIVQ